MLRRSPHLRRLAAAAATLLVLPSGALAKDLCIHTTAADNLIFVLKKASLKSGAHGSASGYAVTIPPGSPLFVPISASFVSIAGGLSAGITRYSTSIGESGSAGSGYSTHFHNIAGDQDRSWSMNSNGVVTIHPIADVEIVDCKSVPRPPRRAP